MNITPTDPRYADLVRKGFNKRFIGQPDYIRLPGSTAETVEAVQEAVNSGRRLVARSGGHCLEGFVGDPAIRVRAFYRDLYASTGGVPVPNEQMDGAMINHPDTDLADPVWNTSGIPWYTLYYKDNYPRLQEIKRKWDPLNVFHHTLSIQP